MARKLFALLGLLIGAALTVVGPALSDAGLEPVDPASENAEGVSALYYYILAFATGIFLLVTGSLVLFIARFRSRGRPREVEGPQIVGHTRLELAWTALPVLILIAIAAFAFYKLPEIDDPEAAAGASASDLEINVVGHRFYWNFRYPNGVIAVDRARVPLGRVVEFEITAEEEDVVHSWWIPALGPKRDSIPGEVNRLRIRATEAGFFEGQCAEFCGAQHAQMTAGIEVLDEAAFDRWLAAEAQAQTANRSALGEQTWEGACAKCHGFEAEGLIGPDIRGNPILREREQLEDVVRNGRGAMPPIGPDWEERQMDALFRYVQRFGEAPPTESDGG